MKKIAIIGSGGHASSLIDLIMSTNKFKIYGYFDKTKNTKINLEYLGNDSEISNHKIKYAAMGIGLALPSKKKMQIIKKYLSLGINFPSLIHKSSYVAKTSEIHEGVQIFAGTVINTNTIIKSHSIINTGSIIEHDSLIGENSFICPGSILLGSCRIGKNTIIGTKNVILPNTKVLDNSFIKAKI